LKPDWNRIARHLSSAPGARRVAADFIRRSKPVFAGRNKLSDPGVAIFVDPVA
jgi:hypothetical protein